MNIKNLAVIIMAASATYGCNRSGSQQSGTQDVKVVSQQQWMANYEQRNKAARDVALSKAADRSQAIKMELAADNLVYTKMVAGSHQPNFSNIPEDQRIQQIRDILTKAEQAKAKMRASNYKTNFQPDW